MAIDTYSAQSSVIGCLLLAPKLAGEIFEGTAEEDFTTQELRNLYAALRHMWLGGQAPDPVILVERTGPAQSALVRQILEDTPTAANFRIYMEQLRESARLERARVAALALADATTPEQVEKAAEQLNRSLVQRAVRQVLDSTAWAGSVYAWAMQDQPPVYLKWGIEALDDALYAEPGDFIILGGEPSSGKTLLALQMAYHMAAEQQKRVGFFSLETSQIKAGARLLSNLSGVPLRNIKTQAYAEGEREAILRAAGQLQASGLCFVPAAGMTVSDIKALCLARGFEVAFIDYLQLIRDDGRSIYERVTNTSIGLHTLSQSTGITVVALAQLSRPAKTEGKPVPPDLHSFRDSGQIEQDADAAMLLYLEDPTDTTGSRRVMKLAKNKEGIRKRIWLSFDGDCQRMTQSLVQADRSEKKNNFRAVAKAIRDANRENRAATSADVQAAAAELEAKDKEREAARAAAEAQISLQDLPDDTPLPF